MIVDEFYYHFIWFPYILTPLHITQNEDKSSISHKCIKNKESGGEGAKQIFCIILGFEISTLM